MSVERSRDRAVAGNIFYKDELLLVCGGVREGHVLSLVLRIMVFLLRLPKRGANPYGPGLDLLHEAVASRWRGVRKHSVRHKNYARGMVQVTQVRQVYA